MADIYRRAVGDDNIAYCLGSDYRVLEAIGPDSFGFREDFVGTDVATNVVPGWTCTLVNASTVTLGTTSGGHLILTTAGADNDGVNAQMDGESFEITTGQNLTYFGVKFQASEATQSDFLVGLSITDTDALGAITDGIYFDKLDGATTIQFVTEKTSTETTSASVGTFAATTDIVLEFYWDGTTAYGLVNGVLKATSITNIPNTEALTPTVHFLTGDNAAETMTVDWVSAWQVGR